jgi:predicted histone-like DNA-binding protein
MAKIIYEVYQNQNSYSQAFGKWYGRVKNLESLNTRKLATHISEHGSIYTPDVVYGVLEKFRSCLIEMLLNSKKVKIEGLGTFYTTLECNKGGAVSKDKFNVNSHVKGLHIRFLPEQEQENNISSRQFLKQAEFINVESLMKSEDSDSGDAGNGGTQQGGNSGSQNSGSQDQGGSQNGGNSDSGNTSGGSQSGNSGSGSNTGDSTGGNTSGDGQQSTYNLTIARSGSGTSTVTDDSENVITGQRRFAPGTNLNIEIVPAEGQIPTARLNYNPIELTENDGTYTGSFQMPAQGSVLELNSGSNGSSSGDDWFDTGD